MTEPQGWVRRLGGYVLRHKSDVQLAVLGAVVGSAAQTTVPLLEREIVDRVILHHESSLWPWLTALFVLAGVGFGCAYLRRYLGGRVALNVQNDLRNAMQEHLQRLDFANLDRMPSGQLVARANSDSALVQALLMFLPLMSGSILLLVLSLAVMVVLSPLLAVVSLLVVPALLVVSYQLRQRTFPATWDAQQREGDVIQIVDEDVNGVRVVKAFGQDRRELEKVAAASQVLYGAEMRAVRQQSRYQPLLQAIPAFGQVGLLALGGTLVLRHHISLGTFLAFTTYLGQLLAPARQLTGVLTIGQQARAGVERIFQLLDTPADIQDAPDAVILDEVRGDIVLDDVRFGYDEHEVLRGLSLHVRAGERVAIVGPSGSGKSTVAMLISRFYDPTSGAVSVDGHDVRQLALASLRRQVGVVFEETFLFSDTVRANIAYGRPSASDEEVEAAARVAAAHDFIAALPHGYDTVVGERGLTLSGGQRQRVALARAVLTDPRVLVLDDATSAVDAQTESSINAALRSVLAGRTTVLVAHRRSTLELADRIVLLDHGTVADQGTEQELLGRSALFRSLLSGLEQEAAAAVGDNVEALLTVTAAAWQGGGPAAVTSRNVGPVSIGAGLGGGGGGVWRMNLAPTPELMAKVAALPPVRDHAVVDLDRESRADPQFSLLRLMREFRRPLSLGLLLVVIDALASLAGPVMVKTGVDDGITKGSQSVLLIASAVFFLILVADLADQVGQTFVTGRAAQRVMLGLRIRIWAQLQRLSLDFYEREMAGRIMTRMTTDVDQFESLVQNGLLSALVAFVTFFGVGVALLVFNLELGLCTLTVIAPLAVATVLFRNRSARLYDLARERIAIVNADFQESLSGVREAQAYVHEDATIAHFQGLGADYVRVRVAAQRLVATYFPFVQLLSAVADAIVLGVGADLVRDGHLTTGVLIAFLIYVDLFFSPVQQLSQVFDAWQQTRISIGRISELMKEQTRTPAAPVPVDPGRLTGAVSLQDLRFAYPARQRKREARGPADARSLVVVADTAPPEAMRGITLTIAAGETVALVGETGAGKSTLVKLLARFYDPDGGSIRVDGHELRDLDLDAYRRQLGYVPQEAFLFSGTLRDNIAYGRPSATDAEVEAAARDVGAHEFIAALPGGYLHQTSERGRSLSSGQRQLIALARAELVDPVLLLLDEATSNLDLASEAKVAEAMRRVSRRRTTIVIAHRLQTARTADRIAVLRDGLIAEVGSHDELLAADGSYAALWRSFEELAPRVAVHEPGSAQVMTLISSSGFSHVRLTVTDITRSKAFYDDVFGWNVAVDASDKAGEPGVSEDPGQMYGGVVYLTPSGTMFGLRPVAPAGQAFDSEHTGLDHVSFAVDSRDDLVKAAAALEDKGIPHGEVIDLTDNGIAILSFSDPDGVHLELTAPL